MKSKEMVAQAVESVASQVEKKDNNLIAQSLVALVNIAHLQGLNSDNVIEILAERGIHGGEFLKEFIDKQFKNLEN